MQSTLQDLARRHMEARIADENLVAIQQRALHKLGLEEDERRTSRATVTDESSFWNVGSTNDRWLGAPSERRRTSPRGGGCCAPPPPDFLRAPFASTFDPSERAAANELRPQYGVGQYEPVGQQQYRSAEGQYNMQAADPGAPWASEDDAALASPEAVHPQHAPLAAAPYQYASPLPPPLAASSTLQRFTSRPESRPCPFATYDAPAPQQQPRSQQPHMAQSEQQQRLQGRGSSGGSGGGRPTAESGGRPACPFATERDLPKQGALTPPSTWAPRQGGDRSFPWA